ncbi:hypothetical protein PSECIP111951_00291 [Pseudoalteromonas holothuriae]|uniref:Uncharacterized protein n=1 Tax=Pseudoalteromonas holothuriae TaxID=2963714 RepID=A0A9W4R0S5_9GAMM|nr:MULTISPECIES: hypothetical protein [unclassified Pseudoalteromonas]CAH9050916.1 hypothetical protein PSECIP111951_00291 [Pseudoalteromonas sp. CIP111951]CAH9061580.1 hypothetical protein PSECIP111854_02839 [Pseudoalteromonas sp. CIP111854]
MDALKPFLTNIVRLEVEHKPMFYIAGVKDGAVSKVKLRRAALDQQRKKLQEQEMAEQQKNTKRKESEEEDDETHLDTWA